MKFLLPDTSALIDHPSITSQVASDDVTVVICTTVMEELDYIKDRLSDTSAEARVKKAKAREASRVILKGLREKKNIIVINEYKKDISLNLKINDNKIIAHASYLKDKGENVVLLSSDNNLQIKAFAQEFGIHVIFDVEQLKDIPDLPSINEHASPLNEERKPSSISKNKLDAVKSFITQDPFESLEEYRERIRNNSIDVGQLTTYLEYDNSRIIVFHCEWNTALPIIFPKTNKLLLKGFKGDKRFHSIRGSLILQGKSTPFLNLTSLMTEVEGEEYSLIPIELEKMGYETAEVYQDRLKAMDSVPIGEVNLVKDSYEIEKQLLPIELAAKHVSFNRSNYAIKNIPPDKARRLVDKANKHTVFASFELCETSLSESKVASFLYVKGNGRAKHSIEPFHAELSYATFSDGLIKLVDSNLIVTNDGGFEEITPFSDDYYLVKRKKKLGLITKDGDTVVSASYTSITKISTQHIRVEKGKKFGLIDSVGAVVLDPIYKELERLGDYYRVKHNQAEQLLNENLDQVGNKLGELEVYAVHKNSKWNLLTSEGNLVSPQWFDGLGDHYQTMILIENNHQWGLLNLDKRNAFSVNPMYESLEWLNKELGLLKGRKDSISYILAEDGEILGETLEQMTPGSMEPLIKLKDKDKGHVFIANEACQAVLPNQFENVGVAVNSCITVQQSGRWGFIRIDGSWALEPVYQELRFVNQESCIGVRKEAAEFIRFEGDSILVESISKTTGINVTQTDVGMTVHYSPNQEEVYIYYSASATLFNEGDVVEEASLTEEGYRQATVISDKESYLELEKTGNYTILLVIKKGDYLIIDHRLETIFVQQVKELKWVIEHNKLYLSWIWPEKVTSISFVSHDQQFLSSPNASHKKMRNGTDNNGKVSLNYTPGQCFFSIFSEWHADGNVYYSKPVFLQVKEYETSTIYYTIRHKKDLLGRYKGAELILHNEGNATNFPNLLLVKKYGSPPINRKDGTPILLVEDLNDSPFTKRKYEISVENLEPNSYVQLFYAQDEEENAIKVIARDNEKLRLW